MRWVDTRPKDWSTRVVLRFLWLPLRLSHQCRWLEFAYVQERYYARWDTWVDVAFVEETT